MEVERIVVTLMADASQYNRVMAASTTTLTTAVREMANMGAMFDAAVRVPVLMAAGAVGAIGVAAGAAVYEGIRLAAAYETAAVSFEVMTGSAARGKQMLEDLNQLAVSTPFRSTELIAGARQLRSFGVGTESVIPVLQALGDVSAGTGTSLNRLTLAFGQVMTVGHLTGGELRQFNNAGVPLAENLAAVMGKPISAIQQLVRAGDVSANDVINAFNRMTGSGGTFADMMVRLNNTVSGQWNTLIENLEFLTRDMGTAFFEGTRLKDLLRGANTWLTGFRDGLSGEGHGGWTEWFAQVRRNVEWLGTQGRLFLDTFRKALNWDGLMGGVNNIAERVRRAFASGEVNTFLENLRADILAFAEDAGERLTFAGRVIVSVFRGARDEVVALYEQGRSALTTFIEDNRTQLQSIAEQAAVIGGVIALVTVGVYAWGVATNVVTAGYGVLRTAVLAVHGVITALNAVMYTSLTAWMTVSTIAGAFSAVVGGIGAAIAYAFPAAVLATFGAGLVYALDLGKAWENLVGTLVSLFKDLGAVASQTWEGFSAAVRANDMTLAWQIAFKGIELAWVKTINALRAEWERFKAENLGGALDSARTDLAKGVYSIIERFDQSRTQDILTNFNPENVEDPAMKEVYRKVVADEMARRKATDDYVKEQKRSLDEGHRQYAKSLSDDKRDEIERIKAEGVAPLQAELDALVQQAKVKDQLVQAEKELVRQRQMAADAEAQATQAMQASYKAAQEAMREAGRAIVTPPIPGFDRRNPFGAVMGGMPLPQPEFMRERIPNLFIPFTRGVEELAESIHKTFKDGVTEVEQFGTAMKNVMAGQQVPPGVGAMMGGAAAFNAAPPRITEEQGNMFRLMEFRKLANFIKDEVAVKPAPTLQAGTAAAMDAINKSDLQQRSIEMKVLDVLTAANIKHDALVAEAKRTADALDKAADKGVILIPKKVESKK